MTVDPKALASLLLQSNILPQVPPRMPVPPMPQQMAQTQVPALTLQETKNDWYAVRPDGSPVRNIPKSVRGGDVILQQWIDQINAKAMGRG